MRCQRIGRARTGCLGRRPGAGLWLPGGAAARAQGGYPQVGWAAQVVGGSGVGSASPGASIGGRLVRRDSAAVPVFITVLGAGALNGGRCQGAGTRVVVVLAIPGERFDGPVEPVIRRGI